MRGHKPHVTAVEPAVLDEWLEAAHDVRLALEAHRLPAETLGRPEIVRTDKVQPVERVKPSGQQAVTIGPLVVSGGVDEGRREAVHEIPLLQQQSVGAGVHARLGVAEVDGEDRSPTVDLRDQRPERRVSLLTRAIGHVAQGHERELRSRRPRREGEARTDECRCEPVFHFIVGDPLPAATRPTA